MDRNRDFRSGASGTITDDGAGPGAQARARGVERPVPLRRATRPRRAVAAAVPARHRPVREAVSVVIPTKNEARNIGWVLRLMPEWIDEVILVDGTSTDSTIDVARAVRPDIVVVEELRPGKGAALRRGFREARGDFVMMIDADGSMDPGEIPLYLLRLTEGYDLVKGSRFLHGGGSEDISHLRRSGNRVLLRLVNVLYGQKFTELCYGMMAFRANRIPDLCLRADGFEIETEIVVSAVRAGLSICEVPSFELERRYGESNLNAFRDGRRVLRTLLVERFRSRRPPSSPREELVVADLAPGSVAPPT
jgi:glycosyltransferase involved in cell wall biosynthesis